MNESKISRCVICKEKDSGWFCAVRIRRTDGPLSGKPMRPLWIKGQEVCDPCVRKARYQEKKTMSVGIDFSKDDLFASAFSVLVDTEKFLV